MAKKKQSQTTKVDNPLFPPTLVGKKLREQDNGLLQGLITKNSAELLKKYLDTQNPEYLFKAINVDNSILQGSGINLSMQEYNIDNKKKDIKSVDKHTIAWESIRHWQNLHNWLGDKEESNHARKLLQNIGISLILPREHRKAHYTNDGLVHVTEEKKGEHPYLTCSNPEEFIKRYEHIRKTFEDAKSKNRYPYDYNQFYIKQDILKAIKKLGNEINDDEVDNLDWGNNVTKTNSYIRLVHEKKCPICTKKGLSDKTISRIYEAAKKQII